MGASAGGIAALSEVLREMPADISAAFLVTLHLSARSESILPRILGRASGLRADQGADGEKIEAGRILVAPPNRHMVLNDGHVHLTLGPRENRQRPSIDPMFRSAAESYGKNVVGIVLSGMLDDGAAGLAVIKQRGGLCIVQEPTEALYPDMPQSALAEAKPHLCLLKEEIRSLLLGLNENHSVAAWKKLKTQRCRAEEFDETLASHNAATGKWKQMSKDFGEPTGFVCPECDGPLWETDAAGLQQFSCLVGHAYSPKSLLAAQGEAVEHALWTALRALEERAELQRRLAVKAARVKNHIAANSFGARAKETERHAATLRRLIESQRD